MIRQIETQANFPAKWHAIDSSVKRRSHCFRNGYLTHHQLYDKARLANLPKQFRRHGELLSKANTTLRSKKHPRNEQELKVIRRLLEESSFVGRSDNSPMQEYLNVLEKQQENIEPEDRAAFQSIQPEKQPICSLSDIKRQKPKLRKKNKALDKQHHSHQHSLEKTPLHTINDNASQVETTSQPLRNALAEFIRTTDQERDEIGKCRHRIDTKLKRLRSEQSQAWQKSYLGELTGAQYRHHWSEQLSKYRKILNHSKLMNLERGRLAARFQQQTPF